MKTTLTKSAVVLAMAAALGAFASTSAQAAVNWNFACSSGCDSTPTPSNVPFGNVNNYNGSSGAPSVAVSAWANTGGSNNTVIQDAYVAKYGGGLGVGNRDLAVGKDGDAIADTDPNEANAPEHAIDNSDRYDSVLFKFGGTDKIALSQVNFGYVSGDADITVLAYTPSGSNPATPVLAGLTYADLTSNGWTLVGHYAGASGTSSLAINGGANPISSSYWLIGAYNPTVGGSGCIKPAGQSYTCTDGNDNFKLSALYGDTVTPPPPPPPPPGDTKGVPEPGTLVLLAAAGLGISLRRRSSK